MPHIVLVISQLPDIVDKYFCTPDGAINPIFRIRYVPAFYNVFTRRKNPISVIFKSPAFFPTPFIFTKMEGKPPKELFSTALKTKDSDSVKDRFMYLSNGLIAYHMN